MKPEAMRGVLLVLGAAAIGALILAGGFDSPATIETDSSPEPTAMPDDAVQPTPTVQPSLTDPADVIILVANGTDTPGFAGSVSTQLVTSFGYTALEPTNATPAPADGLTVVYYASESQAIAIAIAASLGLDASRAQPMPTTPPVPVDTVSVDALVVLAVDVAPPTG
jgi:hypothetical protein